MEYVVDSRELTKQYGKHKAVDSVSLHIKRGEIYGFIGRNGAGKTTFMKMVSGLSSPTSGELRLFGAAGKEAAKYHSRIGNLIEQPGLYSEMTARENLHMKCLALGIHEKDYENRLLATVGLADAGKKRVRQLSLGMKQRLGIAMALVGKPDLLVLDEPVNGLDPQGIAEVRKLLLKLKDEKNMTILISSHILEELYKVADTFGIIHNGVLVQELSKEELYEKCSDYTEIRMSEPKKACPVIEQMGFQNYQIMPDNSIRIFDMVPEPGKLNAELVNAGCLVESMHMVSGNLEEYFLNLTRD